MLRKDCGRSETVVTLVFDRQSERGEGEEGREGREGRDARGRRLHRTNISTGMRA